MLTTLLFFLQVARRALLAFLWELQMLDNHSLRLTDFDAQLIIGLDLFQLILSERFHRLVRVLGIVFEFLLNQEVVGKHSVAVSNLMECSMQTVLSNVTL